MASSIPRIRKRISFSNAAIILVGSSMISQILGFLRTKLINANFVSTPLHPIPTDQNSGVFFAAFVLPDFFFFTIAAGALGVAFIPYLTDHMQKGDRQRVWELSSYLLNFLGALLFVVGVLMFVFADPLAAKLTHGFTPGQVHNVAMMMRIIALNPMIFTISGILSAVQQVYGRFFFYAIAPIFYNISIIASIFIFKNNIGIVGLAVGAAIGAVLQLLIIIFGNYGLGFRWRPTVTWKDAEFRTMLRQLPPRSLDQGMDQVQNVIETKIAADSLVGGATAVGNYNSAYVLHTAPILLIGTAISTAFFPRMNARLSQGRPDLFRKDFLRVLRVVIWITLPVVVVAFFARGYLARLIFSRNSTEISIIFGSLCVAILFRVMYAFLSRWFYAQKDTRTPLLVSVFVIFMNILLAYQLSRPGSYGVQGLAIAQSIVAATEVFILSVVMIIRDRKLFDAEFIGGVVRIVSVTGFSLVTGYMAVTLLPLGKLDVGPIVLGSKLTIITAVVMITHLGVSLIFGLDEAKSLIGAVKRFIFRPVKIEE